MHRIDGPGHDDNLFTEGDPQQAEPATTVTAAWPNDVQEELATVIEEAGIALVKGEQDQLLEAIRRLAGGGHVTALTEAGSPHTLTLAHVGLVLVDAAGGDVVATLPAAAELAAARLRLVRVDGSGNTVTLERAGADTIEPGGTSITLPGQYAEVALMADGVSTWRALAGRGRPHGLAGLAGDGYVPDSQLAPGIERTSRKDANNGYAGLDASGTLSRAGVVRQANIALGVQDDSQMVGDGSGYDLDYEGGRFQFMIGASNNGGGLRFETRNIGAQVSAIRIWNGAGGPTTLHIRSGHITSSPPWYLGGLLVPCFVWALLTPAGQLTGVSIGTDAPWMMAGNGMLTRQVLRRRTAKGPLLPHVRYREPTPRAADYPCEASWDQACARHAETEPLELEMVVDDPALDAIGGLDLNGRRISKNWGMHARPHRWVGRDMLQCLPEAIRPAELIPALIRPDSPIVARLAEAQSEGEPVGHLFGDLWPVEGERAPKILVDPTPVDWAGGPPGVRIVDARWSTE